MTPRPAAVSRRPLWSSPCGCLLHPRIAVQRKRDPLVGHHGRQGEPWTYYTGCFRVVSSKGHRRSSLDQVRSAPVCRRTNAYPLVAGVVCPPVRWSDTVDAKKWKAGTDMRSTDHSAPAASQTSFLSDLSTLNYTKGANPRLHNESAPRKARQ